MNARLLSPAPEDRQNILLRQPTRRDGAALHQLVEACPPLDVNSRYAYLLLCEHHAATSVVAESDGRLVGAITAYIPPDRPDTLFVWQVAVAQPMQGRGLGSRMLEHLLQGCIVPRGLRRIETTIGPSNQASQKLFTGFARRHGVGCAAAPFFTAADFGDGNHEEEQLYQLGPWDRAA
jgi:L-2,4-diaminobutyric acid acetyltransferase